MERRNANYARRFSVVIVHQIEFIAIAELFFLTLGNLIQVYTVVPGSMLGLSGVSADWCNNEGVKAQKMETRCQRNHGHVANSGTLRQSGASGRIDAGCLRGLRVERFNHTIRVAILIRTVQC